MKHIRSRELITNAIWSFSGRFGYLAVGLAANILLARILGPEEFGKIAIAVFFVSIGTVLVESGMSGALVRKQGATAIDFSTVFIFNIGVSLALAILLVAFSGLISGLYGIDELQSVLQVLSITIIFNALRIIQDVKLIKEMRFKTKAACELFSISVGSILGVSVAFAGAGVWALVVCQLASSIVLTLVLWCVVGPVGKLVFKKKSFREFYGFGVNTTAASILSSIFDGMYQLILAKYFSVNNAGQYYQAKKLQDMPVGMLQGAALGVVFSALSKVQDDLQVFERMYKEVVRLFSVAIAILCLAIFLYSDVLVSLLYGGEWGDASHYLKYLSVAAFFYLQETLNRIVFKVFNRTDIILKLEIMKKAAQAITMALGVVTMSVDVLLLGLVVTNIIGFWLGCWRSSMLRSGAAWMGLRIVLRVSLIAVIVASVRNYVPVELFSRGVLEVVSILFLFLLLLVLFGVVSIKKDFVYARNVLRSMK